MSKNDMYRPKDDELHFLPLGGSGEIGMNLNLYGTKGKWLMVDCGVTFGDETTPGIEVITPDVTFIEERAHDLVALVVTHGHEDHLGAIEYLWDKFRCPIYATPFAAELLRAKLGDKKRREKVRIIEIEQGGNFTLGPFKVEFIHVTHSIPESNMLAITTHLGTIIHTGDWKLDPTPLIGKVTDEKRLRELGEAGVLAVVGDSTNATVQGHSLSELDARNGLNALFSSLSNRIVVTCFSSNIARVKTIIAAAEAHNRQPVLVGRSLWRNTEVADFCGYLPEFPTLLAPDEIEGIARDKLVFICTGSQGELRSALSRLAAEDHPELSLDRGDVVVYSSRDIPGNEKAIGRVQNLLMQQGVQIIRSDSCEHIIHASGHAARDEIKTLYSWLKPKTVIPVHGEFRHQSDHESLAKECGATYTLIPTNGQIIRLAPGAPEVIGEVQAGQMGLDGRTLRPINQGAMKKRQKIGYSGLAVASIVLDRKGELVDLPRISLLGIVDDHEREELQEELADSVADAIDKMPKNARKDDDQVIKTANNAIRRIINESEGKKPISEIHVIRV